MDVKCPKGWIEDWKLKEQPTPWQTPDGKTNKVIIGPAIVNICGGFCDSGDLCKNESCEFYDLSRSATRRFNRACCYEETLEGDQEMQRLKSLLDEGLDPVIVLKHMANYPQPQ